MFPPHHDPELDPLPEDANDINPNQLEHNMDLLQDNQDNFDPSSLEEYEQQRENAHAAELHAHISALRIFSKLDEPPTSDGDGEASNILPTTSRIDSIKTTQQFINAICCITLDNGNLDNNLMDHLRNPSEQPADISDPDIWLSLDLFLAVTNASEDTYKSCCNAILHHYPNSGVLSYHSVKKLVAEFSGVVAVYDDMCINSCHAFTGPFSQLESCSVCGEAQYSATQSGSTGRKIPCQQFCTILLSPQLQALCQSYLGAKNMGYLDEKMKEVFKMLDHLQTEDGADIVYDDILCSSEMQVLAKHINLMAHDTVVSLSLDGAQLYQNKKSDIWLSIWVLHNFPPNLRYQKRHVFPRTIIPGPNKPKITDSYLFWGIHHLSALQCKNNRAGLRMWDAIASAVVESCIILSLATADALGLTEIDGRVGHHGAYGCQLGCPMKGHHKPNAGHYFAVHLKPNGYTIRDCNHPNIDMCNLRTLSSEDY
jgi:hypothetical protein